MRIEEIESPGPHSHPLDHPYGFQTSLAKDERWQAVRRIVVSASFAKSSRLSSFLLYVSEKTLLNCTDEITEQQIGVNVFGRSTDYNPGDDNIVRGVARQLRQRLALYYQEEGALDAWRISIPRGGYVAVFERYESPGRSLEEPESQPLSLAESEETTVALPPQDQPSLGRWRPYALSLVAFVLGVLTVVGWQHFSLRKAIESPHQPAVACHVHVKPSNGYRRG